MWLVLIFATPIVPRAWLASCLVLMARVWNCLVFMSRMLCRRWVLYLRSMFPHAEAIGIKTYCIETTLPQGRKALALFVVVGFAMCVCAWPPEASPGSGLKPVIRDPSSQFITLARNCAKTNGVRFSVVVSMHTEAERRSLPSWGVSWSTHCGFRPTTWEVSTPDNRFRKSCRKFSMIQ